MVVSAADLGLCRLRFGRQNHFSNRIVVTGFASALACRAALCDRTNVTGWIPCLIERRLVFCALDVVCSRWVSVCFCLVQTKRSAGKLAPLGADWIDNGCWGEIIKRDVTLLGAVDVGPFNFQRW
jgi:hypothetical protein